MRKIALFIILALCGCAEVAVGTSQTRRLDKNSGVFFNTITLRNQTDYDARYLAICALSLPSDPDVIELFASTGETMTKPQYLVRKNKWQHMYERWLTTAYGPRDFWWVETIVPRHEERTITIMTSAFRGEKFVLVCEISRGKLTAEMRERGLK